MADAGAGDPLVQIQQVKLKLLLNLNERGETAGYTTWNPPEKFRLGD